jgi:Thrombospondin type 3 repeat
VSRCLVAGLVLAAALTSTIIALTGCADGVPTSVLLRIEAAAALPPPDRLALSVYNEQGTAVSARSLPTCVGVDGGGTCPPPQLPGEVVLYPDPGQSSELRILVQALQGTTVVGEGVAKASVVAGAQTSAVVTVQPDAMLDADGDGVPDAIDNCPQIPNPDQGPCQTSDGGLDAGPDAPGDAGGDGPPLPDGPALDSSPDGPPPPDAQPPDTVPPCTCPLGCQPNSSTCRLLVPANGYSATSYAQASVIKGAATVTTTTCVMTNPALTGKLQTDTSGKVQACVIALKQLALQKAASLTVTGTLPLVLLVSGDATIGGLIDVAGHGNTPGPGGGAGGVRAASNAGTKGEGPGGGGICGCGTGVDDCGGGGGGHAVAGTNGGAEGTSCTTVAGGGPIYGKDNLVPLTAGSGGASGGELLASNTITGPGGGGGGALQISCGGALTINSGGAINASGGGGLAAKAVTSLTVNVGLSAGGGGSGGGVLLEAAAFSGSGVVAANGGGGGGGGGSAGSTACTAAGKPGEDGKASKTAAAGGAPGGATCGAGGPGGVGSTGAGPGGNAAVNGGGGGGGGAVGWLRFNRHNAGTVPFSTSGKTSAGNVTVK